MFNVTRVKATKLKLLVKGRDRHQSSILFKNVHNGSINSSVNQDVHKVGRSEFKPDPGMMKLIVCPITKTKLTLEKGVLCSEQGLLWKIGDEGIVNLHPSDVTVD